MNDSVQLKTINVAMNMNIVVIMIFSLFNFAMLTFDVLNFTLNFTIILPQFVSGRYITNVSSLTLFCAIHYIYDRCVNIKMRYKKSLNIDLIYTK